MSTPYAHFEFGIYPGGHAGGPNGMLIGPPDNPSQIKHCLDDLQGASRPLIVRAYKRFSDEERPSPWPAGQPEDYEQYAGNGRLLDLVLLFQSKRGDVEAYLDFLNQMVTRYAPSLYSVQVTEEASVNGSDVLDGAYPNVLKALVEGVKTVKSALRNIGKPQVLVGFNTTPTFGPAFTFWSEIRALAGPDFLNALDYVGLDFFPDVFRRLAPDGLAGDLERSARMLLQVMRNEWMPAAGISAHIPIHITEHGWATGPSRSEERQAEVIDKIVRLVWQERERLNIARYTLFDLRDSGSFAPGNEEELCRHFGITREDYSPKQAYAVFRALVQEFGSRA